MSFRVGQVFNLQFGGYMSGAEVRIRSGSIQDMHALFESTDVNEVIEIFLKYAISWNFEDSDGNAIPLEKEAVRENVDEVTLVHMWGAWYKASTKVSGPLEEESTSGESSPEESIQTEPL